MQLVNIIVLLLLMVADYLHAFSDYEIGKCYCYSDTDHYETLMETTEFTEEVFPPMYQYLGVLVKGIYEREPCLCSDVTILTTDVKMANIIIEASQTIIYLENMKKSMEKTSPELKKRIELITIPDMLENANAMQPYSFEIVLKGQNETLQTYVELAFAAYVNKPDAVINFRVLECADDPDEAPMHGQIIWNNIRLAGNEVFYTCDEGFILADEDENKVSCSPINETWTTVNATCIPGCAEDPPDKPLFTLLNWLDNSRVEGAVIEYVCRKNYKSFDGSNATTTCLNGNWTDIEKSDSFKCEEIVCFRKDMPVLPAWATIEWNGQQSEGTTATYGCLDGYKPFFGSKSTITCHNAVWETLEEGWRCVPELIQTRREILDNIERQRFADALLDKQEKEDKEALEINQNLFLFVTTPAFLGILIILSGVMCFIRIDSPLFKICSKRYMYKKSKDDV